VCRTRPTYAVCLEPKVVKRASHPHGPFRRRRRCHGLAAGARCRCGHAHAVPTCAPGPLLHSVFSEGTVVVCQSRAATARDWAAAAVGAAGSATAAARVASTALREAAAARAAASAWAAAAARAVAAQAASAPVMPAETRAGERTHGNPCTAAPGRAEQAFVVAARKPPALGAHAAAHDSNFRSSSALAGVNNKPGRVCADTASSLRAPDRTGIPHARRVGTAMPAGASDIEGAPCSSPQMRVGGL